MYAFTMTRMICFLLTFTLLRATSIYLLRPKAKLQDLLPQDELRVLTPRVDGIVTSKVQRFRKFSVFRDHLALFEREQGLQKITVHRLPAEGGPPGDRPRGPLRFEGERRFGDRDGYRGGPRSGGEFGDKSGAPADYDPSFRYVLEELNAECKKIQQLEI